MKVYFAGISGNKKRLGYLKKYGASKLMLTYAEAKSYNKQMPRFKEGGFDILFDSGAFSLWKRGIEIDLNQYCDYLVKHQIEKYIVLDKIGDYEETAKNQLIMEERGMKPIPVFHIGSPIEVLREICSSHHYVCLGGTVGKRFAERFDFFSSVFQEFPNHKFHGLGLTDNRLLQLFPFFSVDSTTWLCAEKVGNILDKNGKQFKAPLGMDSERKFENTIGFFAKLDN